MLDLKGNKITYFGHSTFGLTTPSWTLCADRSMGTDQSEMSRGQEKDTAPGRHFFDTWTYRSHGRPDFAFQTVQAESGQHV